jgi:hypothetical protein
MASVGARVVVCVGAVFLTAVVVAVAVALLATAASPHTAGRNVEGPEGLGLGASARSAGSAGSAGQRLLEPLQEPYAALNLVPPPSPSRYCFSVPFVLQDGVPLVAVRITSQPNLFVCVADTGSMELNLSGSGCARCDRGYGQYQHTPALDAADSQVLTYGTQRDVVKQVRDEIQFHAGGQVYPLHLCVTVERTKSLSNFNVLGLQDGRAGQSQDEGSNSTEGVLGNVFGAQHSLLVRFDATNGGGTLAGVTAAGAAAFRRRATLAVPLTWSDMGFFMTRVDAVQVGGARIATTARLIIWDTGSNLTSLPKLTFAKCVRGLRARQPLTFWLDGGAAFVVEAEQYMWHNRRDLMVDDDLQVLGPKAPGYIIMGAYCMQGYQLLFTPDRLFFAPAELGPIETL